jgi:ABC-type bacteriocin/lantibiotic exporter with double-glycine peptidase domain
MSAIFRLIAARVVAASLTMLSPLFIRQLIDGALPRRDWRLFWNSVAGLALVVVAGFALTVYGSAVNLRLEQMLGVVIRRALQAKWRVLSVSFFYRWGVGEHIYRVNADVQNVVSALTEGLPALAILHLQFLVFLALAARLSLTLTLWAVAVIPVVLLIEICQALAIRPIQARIQSLSSGVNDSLAQYVTGISTVKALNIESRLSRRYLSLLSAVVREIVVRWRLNVQYQTLGWLCSTLWPWMVSIYGFSLVMRGNLTLGTLIAVNMYLQFLMQPVAGVAGLVQSLSVSSVSADRLQETLSSPHVEIARPVALTLNRDLGSRPPSLSFEGVEFGYETGSPLFRNLRGSIAPGSLTGLCGPSGSGKTTLIALVLRLYECWSGRICLAGCDIRLLPLKELRSVVSVVPQDTFLIRGTIRENISLGGGDEDAPRVKEAAQLAEADGFISAMDRGYETVVGGLDSGLSVGQRQRIGLARVLYRASPLLIFDEALNSVELPCRRRLMSLLRELSHKHTILVVSHDPEIIESCTHVLSLMGGGVVEQQSASADLRGSGFLDYLRLKERYERAGTAPTVIGGR